MKSKIDLVSGANKMAVYERSPFGNPRELAMDYENMSNEELYLLLKEMAPAVAEIAHVSDSNRETVIGILILSLGHNQLTRTNRENRVRPICGATREDPVRPLKKTK